MSYSAPPSFNISFQNEVVIYEQNIICHVKDNEFNTSYNPTLLNDNIFSGSCFPSYSLNTPLPELKEFATSSYFNPYVTTIGLYNEKNDLLAIAKLSQPIQLPQETDVTFIIKYDK